MSAEEGPATTGEGTVSSYMEPVTDSLQASASSTVKWGEQMVLTQVRKFEAPDPKQENYQSWGPISRDKDSQEGGWGWGDLKLL